MNKFDKIALTLIVIIIFIVNISIFIRSDMDIGEINLKLFTSCLILGWILATLFDMDIVGNKIISDRGIWKQTKGGLKPMIKWPILVLRSLLLFIVCLLINHIAPDIYAILIK